MARVTGPLHSDGASGTLGGTIVFGTWKGRAYVRTHVIPANPKTAKQTGVRKMMKFLATAWAAVKVASAGSWQAAASAGNFSTYNAYCAANLKRWQNFLAPSASYPAAAASAAVAVATQTVTGGVKQVTLAITPASAVSVWGIAIFKGATGFTPMWSDCIAILAANGTNPVQFVDSVATAGTSYYRSAVFNTDGTMGAVHAETAGTAS